MTPGSRVRHRDEVQLDVKGYNKLFCGQKVIAAMRSLVDGKQDTWLIVLPALFLAG